MLRKASHDVEKELEQVALAVELEKQHKEGSYKSCFQDTSLRRTLIVLGSNFFLQASGQAFVSLYGPVVVASIGSISTFNYTLIAAGCTMLGYVGALTLNDYVGRRPIMLVGSAMQCVSMFAIAGAGNTAPACR